jgi:hypothetical protein
MRYSLVEIYMPECFHHYYWKKEVVRIWNGDHLVNIIEAAPDCIEFDNDRIVVFEELYTGHDHGRGPNRKKLVWGCAMQRIDELVHHRVRPEQESYLKDLQSYKDHVKREAERKQAIREGLRQP